MHGITYPRTEKVVQLRANPLLLDRVPPSQIKQHETVAGCLLTHPKSMTPLYYTGLDSPHEASAYLWAFALTLPSWNALLPDIPRAGSSFSSNVIPSVRPSAHILFHVALFYYIQNILCMTVSPQVLQDPFSHRATTFNPHTAPSEEIEVLKLLGR